MKISLSKQALILAGIALTTNTNVAAFMQGSMKRSLTQQQGKRVVLYYLRGDDDEKSPTRLPETSFGAEVVPEGQRPVNEYLDLLRAPLFGWASEEVGTKGFITRVSTFYAVIFAAVCYPISGATFTRDGFELQKFASSNLGAMTLVVFLLLRLYSGWGYVGARLQSKVIEYEETGWYDGDIEVKSEAEKQRDRMLYQDSVKPAEDRLKTVGAGVAVLWALSCLSLNISLNAKPVFNEYDPQMLEVLRYNDRVAGVAADQSFNRPTYCDSRYYRAVAGGGQGCD